MPITLFQEERLSVRSRNEKEQGSMIRLGRTQLFAALAVGGLLLGSRQVEARYRHFDPPPPPPPTITPPPPVITTGGPECHHPHEPPPPDTPPGTTQHAPEPATLV